MKIDIQSELRDFIYITSVYKLISTYNLKGHQIGRKVGDMLEIITMGGVYQNPELVRHLDTEGKLEGFTGAGHKVEFGFYKDVKAKRGLFGAIECKCVGVEETTSGKGEKSKRYLNRKKPEILFDLQNRWMKGSFVISALLSDNDELSILANGNPISSIHVSDDTSFKIIVDENERLYVAQPGEDISITIPGIIRVCKTVKVVSRNPNLVCVQLFDCLTGPQTIEKAKQASLVAMDLRRKIDGHWGKEEIPDEQKKMTFIHVICEYSHWEEKSRNVVRTCIDHNVIVPDAVIMYAFRHFETIFGEAAMLDKISKNEFLLDETVRNAVQDILRYFEGYVFFDLEKRAYVSFELIDGFLRVVSKE